MNRELLIYVATDLYSAGYGMHVATNEARIAECFDIAELILAEGKRRFEADIRTQVKPRPPPTSPPSLAKSMRGARAAVEAEDGYREG